MVRKTWPRCTPLPLEHHRLDHPSVLARHRLLVHFLIPQVSNLPQTWQGPVCPCAPVQDVCIYQTSELEKRVTGGDVGRMENHISPPVSKCDWGGDKSPAAAVTVTQRAPAGVLGLLFAFPSPAMTVRHSPGPWGLQPPGSQLTS